MARTDALIVAAGSSERFGGGEPKQFVELAGKPLLAWSIERFAQHGSIDSITIVTAADQQQRIATLADRYGRGKVGPLVTGGDTRQQSVLLGLKALDSTSAHVLVHDAARPCLSRGLLDRLVSALEECDAVVPVMPVVDTLVRESNGEVDAIVDRAQVFHVQTPQAFKTELLVRAHRRAASRGFISSDDGSLVRALPAEVRTVAGSRDNIKVTYEEDIAIAAAVLDAMGKAQS